MVTIIKKGTAKEDITKQIDRIIAKSPKKDIKKFAGKLSTELNPLEYQKQMRDEWQ